VQALHREILDAVRGLPGVQSAATTSLLPVSFNGNTDWIRFVGRPYSGEHNEVNQREVSIGYFDTIGARLLQGRNFHETDEQQDRRVLIINRRLAALYFPGEDPIGKQIGDTQLTPASLKEIIGVIDNIHEGSLDAEVWPSVYYPFHMDPSTSYFVVVRAASDAGAMLGPIRAAVRRLHPDIGIMDEITMEQRIRMSPTASLHRSAAWLVGGFAGLALLVGVVGLYGVVAYAVSQRTREIGVRMALGAAPRAVYRLVLREVVVLSLTAAVIGLAGSLAASRFMRGFFYGVGATDAPLLAGATVVLVGAAIVASYLPARRAALVNPLEALRTE
jgi:predicted permease